jgi:hypothetical protein
MRRSALLLLFLVFASSATAATIRGSKAGDRIVGTPNPDHIVSGAGSDLVQAAFGGSDSVDCGAGSDVVSADAVDKVNANCELVSRRISVDPYANADSQHETAVEPDSASWGDTVVAVYQLGRRESGAAANIGSAVSRDDGRTWTRAQLPNTTVNAVPPGPEVAASDPVVAYDAVHGVWIAATLTLERNSSHVFTARSTDGEHWAAPVDAAEGPILDKDWISCDNGAASPFHGRCYLEYTDDQKNITVSQFSTDGGLTWSTPVRAGSVLVGTQPVVQPNGTLVVVAGNYTDEDALSGSMVALLDLDRFRPARRRQHTDAGDLAAVGRGRLERGAVRNLVGLQIPGRLHEERSRARDLDRRHHVDRADTDHLRDRCVHSRAGRRSVASRPACGRVHALLRHVHARSVLGASIVQSDNGGKTWNAPQRLDAQPFSTNWLPRAEGGRMVGDYLSTSYAGSRVVPVFALATSPLKNRFREAIFAASLRPLG